MRFAAAILVLCIGVAAGQKLSVSRYSFRNNDPITVELDVPSPTGNDVVALYQKGADTSALRPLKYKWAVTSSKDYVKTGKGKLRFNLLNQRKDVQFVFFSNVNSTNGGFTKANEKTRSPIVFNAAPNSPEHGHLALTKNQGEMLIQWTTRDAGAPEAFYGTSRKALNRRAAGTSKTYGIKDLCGAPATTDGWVEPGTLHTALMTGLEPNTRYYYKYGEKGQYSPIYSFLTAPPVGPDSTVKFVAVADLGHTEIDGSDEYDYDPSGDSLNLVPDGTQAMARQTITELIYDNAYQQSGSRRTVNAIVKDLNETPDKTLFLLNGDVSYARGMQTMWDVFMDQLQPIGVRVPWMLIDGNHERDFANSGDRYNNDTYTGNYDSGGECGVVLYNRFQMPKAPGPQKVAGGYITRDGASGPFKGPDISPTWYSYDHGPIHYLVYSTELDFYPGSPQYNFMEADLKAVDRSKTPWVILNGHRPIYTTNTGGSSPYGVIPVARDLRIAIEDLLYKYDVDLTLHGHDHIYERTCPIFRETCMGKNSDGSNAGPVHVVIGNAGYELSWFYNPFYPKFWETIAVEHGYLRCEASSITLHCQMISSISGKQLDEFTLRKPHGWQPDTAKRTAFAQTFVSNYKPATVLETLGITNYGAVLKPLFTDVAVDTTLLQEIVNKNKVFDRPIDHAIEQPDTLVDDCEVLKPAIDIIKNQVLAKSQTTAAGADSAINQILPQYEAVCMVAEHYKKGSGIVTPKNAVAKKPVPLSESFRKAQGTHSTSKPAKKPTKHGKAKHG